MDWLNQKYHPQQSTHLRVYFATPIVANPKTADARVVVIHPVNNGQDANLQYEIVLTWVLDMGKI